VATQRFNVADLVPGAAPAASGVEQIRELLTKEVKDPAARERLSTAFVTGVLQRGFSNDGGVK